MSRTRWPPSRWRANSASSDEKIRTALANFAGVSRRFTRVGEWNGAAIIDDYAHNPFKIAAALKAARQAYAGPVIAVVQPHRYTRLRDTFEQFCQLPERRRCRDHRAGLCRGRAADRRHQSRYLCGGAARATATAMCCVIDGEAISPALVAPLAKQGGAIVLLGAGSITQWAHALASAIEAWRAGVMMTRPCDALPPVRGTYTQDAPLKDLVWFRAGGPAEILFRPADADDLATFLSASPPETRVSVIGVGSNLLVRDGGIPGVVVRLPARVRQDRRSKARASARAPRRSTPLWRVPRPMPASAVSNSCAAFPAPSAARCA